MLTANSERGGIVGLLGREIKLEEEFRLRKDRKRDTGEMPGVRQTAVEEVGHVE